jgi:uncharacterized coiled-coil DUF342 family protein
MDWLVSLGVAYINSVVNSYYPHHNKARKNWEAKRIQVKRSLEEHQRNIDRHIAQAQSSYDFHFLTDLHHSSVNVADAAYKLLNDARDHLAGINELLVGAKEQRTTLQATLESARTNKDKALIYDTIEQLKMVNELRKTVFEEKEKLKQEKEHLFAELQNLNHRTKELKDLIKTQCGIKGRDWYNRRLEARKSGS